MLEFTISDDKGVTITDDAGKDKIVKGTNIIGAMHRFIYDKLPAGLGADVRNNFRVWITKNGKTKLEFRVADCITNNWNDWGTFTIKAKDEAKLE